MVSSLQFPRSDPELETKSGIPACVKEVFVFSASPLTRTVTGFAVILIVLFLLAPLAKPQTCNGPGKERWLSKPALPEQGLLIQQSR